MAVVREYWPIQWTTSPRATASVITIFDLSELRSVLDTNRISAGLAPMKWAGSSDADPTFVAGRTLVRAVHFQQLREALAELFEANHLGPLSQFGGGPIVPNTRAIGLGDLLEPRSWTERYEACCPELAARVVRRYDDYSTAGKSARHADGRLTEMWDGAGFARYFYDRAGRLSEERRVLDNHEYRTAYHYGPSGTLAAITYPDGERLASHAPGNSVRVAFWRQSRQAVAAGPPASGEEATVQIAGRLGRQNANTRRDHRGRPLLLGDPAKPLLRLAYDGNGRLVKRLDDQGTCHLPCDHFERLIAADGRAPERVVKYVPDGQGGRWMVRDSSSAKLRRAASV